MRRSNPAESAGEASQRYAARMVYLTEEDEDSVFGVSGSTLEPMRRTLKPPFLFMSRRQARADSALCMKRARKNVVEEVHPERRGVRTQAVEKKHLIIARRNDAGARAKCKSESNRLAADEIPPEEEPGNWRRVKEAGVVFWINDITGVATEEYPCSPLQPLTFKGGNPSIVEERATAENLEGALEVGQDEGTGALVYDRSEFEQTMRILEDGIPLSPVNTP